MTMSTSIAQPRVHHTHLHDRRIAFAFSLTRPDGTPIDLTGLECRFKMVAADGSVKVDDALMTITNAAAGECQYQPEAADVDTPGRYRGYVVVIDPGSELAEHVPVKMGDLSIIIHDD